ncbi:MAG TPA: sterol desaturase family protein [Planctomycetota bacterium]|nr:sterol desaturase family protein [Planctomycetota bacterium]
MPPELSYWQYAIAIAAIDVTRYLLVVGTAFLLLDRRGRRTRPHRKIEPGQSTATDVRREVLLSLRSALVFGLVGAAVFTASKHGHTRLYTDLGAHGAGWFVASIALTIVIHDAYFYWTHRLMHTRLLFGAVHRVHHRSTNPTAWAAYSFSVPEALIQAGIFPLVAWLLPIHPLAFATFMLFQITENALGHAGYEIFPRGLMRTPLGALTNTPTHHVQHHQVFNANFGLYFNVWDRLLGTNHRDYARRFDEVTARPRTQVAS